MKKRILCFILAMCILIALPACSQGDATTEAASATQAARQGSDQSGLLSGSDGYYNVSRNLPIKLDMLQYMSSGGEYLYFASYKSVENNQIQPVFTKTTLNGDMGWSIPAPIGVDCRLVGFEATSGGELWVGYAKILEIEEESFKADYYLIRVDQQGQVLTTVDLKQYGIIDPDSESQEPELYIYSLTADTSGRAVLSTNAGILIVEAGGSLVNAIEPPDDLYLELLSTTGGQIIAVDLYSSAEEAIIYVVDLVGGSLSERIAVPITDAYLTYLSAGDDCLYMYSDINLYKVSLPDGSISTVTAWEDAGLDARFLFGGLCTGNEFSLATYSPFDNRYQLTTLYPGSVGEMAELKLALIGDNENRIRNVIGKFNDFSEDYIVVTESFETVDDLNLKLATGYTPDLLFLLQMPFEQYATNGLLKNLDEYMEADSSINEDDFFSGPLSTMRYGGGTYWMSPEYIITAFMGLTDVVGESPVWSLRDMADAWEIFNDGTEVRELEWGASKSGMLTPMLMLCMTELMDWTTGTCNFESELFIDILEFCNLFNDEFDPTKITDNPEIYSVSQGRLLRDRRIMVMFQLLTDPQVYIEGKTAIEEPYSYILSDGRGGLGSVLNLSAVFGIYDKAPNAEGAWSFISYLLSEQYQDTCSNLPLLRSSLEKRCLEAMEPVTYIDEKGNTVTSSQYVSIEGEMVKATDFTQQDIDRFMTLVEDTNIAGNSYTDIFAIVLEDSDAYFKGEKSAQEVASIVQNRMTNYMSERLN